MKYDGFLFLVLFDPGGFLQNIGKLVPDYMALQPGRSPQDLTEML
jgi:hypothetical protein